jgi:hypothetical protein
MRKITARLLTGQCAAGKRRLLNALEHQRLSRRPANCDAMAFSWFEEKELALGAQVRRWCELHERPAPARWPDAFCWRSYRWLARRGWRQPVLGIRAPKPGPLPKALSVNRSGNC